MGNTRSSSASEAGGDLSRTSSRRSGRGRRSKSSAASCPDLDRAGHEAMRDRASSFDGLDEVVPKKAEVKIYRSYSEAEDAKRHLIHPAEPNVDIKVYRRSTTNLGRTFSSNNDSSGGDTFQRGVPRSMTLPRSMGANRAVIGGGPRSSATLSNQRHSAIEPGTLVTDAMAVKRKVLEFETQFVKHITDLHSHLSDFLQLSALSIAIGSLPQQHPLSLWEYLTNENIPLDLTACEMPLGDISGNKNQTNENFSSINSSVGSPTIKIFPSNTSSSGGGMYKLTIPPAMFHGVMHLRRDGITDREQRLSLAQELFVCLVVEAAAELSAMFEYQISLMSGNREIDLLALHAAQCSISYLKANNRFIDRNTVVRGVMVGRLPLAVEDQKIFSVVVGNTELKWILDEVFKLPGLMRQVEISGKTGDPKQEQWEWRFFATEDSQPEKYGYRMVMWEKDFLTGQCRPCSEDLTMFTKEVPSSGMDLHQMYKPKHQRVNRGAEFSGVEVRGRSRSYDGLLDILDEDESTKRVQKPVPLQEVASPRTPLSPVALATIEECEGQQEFLPPQTHPQAYNPYDGRNARNSNIPIITSTPITGSVQNKNGEWKGKEEKYTNGSTFVGYPPSPTRGSNSPQYSPGYAQDKEVQDSKRNSNVIAHMPDLLAYSTPRSATTESNSPRSDTPGSDLVALEQGYNNPRNNNNIKKYSVDQYSKYNDPSAIEPRYQLLQGQSSDDISSNSSRTGVYSPTTEEARRISASHSPTSPTTPGGKVPPKVPVRKTPYSGNRHSTIGDVHEMSQPKITTMRMTSQPPLNISDVGAIESVSSVHSSKSSLSESSQQPRFTNDQQNFNNRPNSASGRPQSSIELSNKNPRSPPVVPPKPMVASPASYDRVDSSTPRQMKQPPTAGNAEDFMNFNDFLNVLRASQSADVLENLSGDSRVQSMIISSPVVTPGGQNVPSSPAQQHFARSSSKPTTLSSQRPTSMMTPGYDYRSQGISSNTGAPMIGDDDSRIQMSGGFPDLQNFMNVMRVSNPDGGENLSPGDISPDSGSSKSRGSSGSGGIMKSRNAKNSSKSSQHKVQFVPYDYSYDPITNTRTEIRQSVGDDVFEESERPVRKVNTSLENRGVLVSDL